MNFEPQCKTQEQLHLEMARVCRMCDGTKVKVWDCVKHNGVFWEGLSFDGVPITYEFAIAIVEGKPVFRGDELYHENLGKPVIVHAIDTNINYLKCSVGMSTYAFLHKAHCSWNPPKPKTLTIELPYDDVVFFFLKI